MPAAKYQTTVSANLIGLRQDSQEAELIIAGTNQVIRCSTAAFNSPDTLRPLLYRRLHCTLTNSREDTLELVAAYPAVHCDPPVKEAKQLRARIRKHDHLYYQDQNPALTDTEYDLLMKRLVFLEEHHPEIRDPHSPTQRVAGTPSPAFTQVSHPSPMLSLGNAFDEQDFDAWHHRTANLLGDPHFPMHLEIKIDGLAVRLLYQDGKLVLAATRGNGLAGEDVTHTVKTVRNIPLTLLAHHAHLEARGEVYMPRSTFRRLNEERALNGLEPFANPRNAAAGGVRQLDPKATAKRGLAAWMYSSPDTPHHTQGMALDGLKAMGLPVNPFYGYATSKAQVLEFYQKALAEREHWDYDADGIVIKVDDLAAQQQLGATGREPRWAIAWKFPPEQVRTTLQRIEISHGRFGKLTPVAVLDPVNVGGVTVRNATLHNEQDIHRKDVREGAVVLLERAGDVIPQVTGPADPEANRSLPKFQMPKDCPACGTPVVQPEGDAAHWCINEDCPAKLPEQIQHFVGKSAMDIEGLGTHWAQAFIEKGLVNKPADVYTLTREQLLALPRMGEKLADRVMSTIERSKEQPLQRVLYSLGIFRLGREVSTLLSQRYTSIEDVTALTKQDLTDIDGIGPVIADSVFNGLRTPRVIETINTMRANGVLALQEEASDRTQQEKDKEKGPMTTTNTLFTGKNVVVTGKLDGMTRGEAEGLISRMGGNPSGSVTKNTDYLVVGDKPGSKLKKANSLGVQVMTEAEFRELLSK